jgi:hypothetical protein
MFLPSLMGFDKAGFGPPLLLDTYPGAAAAYSVRKLRTAYTGNAIRVRRSSDNTEQNIGFTALGNLDTSALTTFCSGTNGFVTTWYDQSGNAFNATQSTAANQPQIVLGGNIVLLNNKISIDFDGTDDKLLSSFSLISQPNTIFSVASLEDTSTLRLIYDDDGGNDRNTYDNNGVIFAGLPALSGTPWAINTQYLHSILYNGISSSVYRNGALNVSGILGTQGLSGLTIGARFSGNFWDGKIQEIIIYNSNQSSNRTGISTNINTYYAIY